MKVRAKMRHGSGALKAVAVCALSAPFSPFLSGCPRIRGGSRLAQRESEWARLEGFARRARDQIMTHASQQLCLTRGACSVVSCCTSNRFPGDGVNTCVLKTRYLCMSTHQRRIAFFATSVRSSDPAVSACCCEKYVECCQDCRTSRSKVLRKKEPRRIAGYQWLSSSDRQSFRISKSRRQTNRSPCRPCTTFSTLPCQTLAHIVGLLGHPPRSGESMLRSMPPDCRKP